VSAAEAANTLGWVLGDNSNPNYIGAPLHSRPAVVTYDATDESDPDKEKIVFFGTSQGYLHAIDAKSGKEKFGFIPRELLPTLPTLANGTRELNGELIYGLDGTPVVAINAEDPKDIGASATDEVKLFIGMRRGGRQYYALDVTDVDSPALDWVITGGESGFEKLGQTWSTPVRTAVIDENGDRQEVLLFAGGYDPALDETTTRQTSTVGNAIFMVNAEDGTPFWMASNGGGDLTDTRMKYSIPSDITVVDHNRDGVLDYLVVGDTGGQLWRIDFHPNKPKATMAFASVLLEAADGSVAGNRRFFHAPDVSVVNFGAELRLAIGIGSGDRSAPLGTDAADRFYMVFSDFPLSSPTTALATQTPTDRTTDTGSPGLQSWWLGFPANSGEKVLSSSITLNNTVIFSTVAPHFSGGDLECSDNLTQGLNRVWGLNLFDASAVVDLDGTAGPDRVAEMEMGGMLPQADLVVSEGAVSVIGGLGRFAESESVEIQRGNPDNPTLFQED
jgi:type IV pilus assembly protein PilY1